MIERLTYLTRVAPAAWIRRKRASVSYWKLRRAGTRQYRMRAYYEEREVRR